MRRPPSPCPTAIAKGRTMPPKTVQDGINTATAIATEHGLELAALRAFAGAHLQQTHPDLEEIGSSDVSIHLSALANHHPDLLGAIARQIRERDDLVAKVTAATGRTAEETLENLRRIFPLTGDDDTATGQEPAHE